MEEWFFRAYSENRIERDHSARAADLERALAQYIEYHDNKPRPFIWAVADGDILAKVPRSRAALARVDR